MSIIINTRQYPITSIFAGMGFLQVISVTKKEGSNLAVKGISFTHDKLKKIAIAGETGSGKSTLLKIAAGIISPDTGEVWFEGQRMKRIPEEKLIPGHPGIAYLSQQFELPHFLTVEQVLIYANALPDDEAAKDENAKKLYELCGISHLLDRRTDQLSGGERQRIALARLLVTAPRLLLLDEPFSNLDVVHKNTLKQVLRNVEEHLGLTCILVSHDPQDTLSWADEMIVMKDGEIIQQATPQHIYTQPVNEYAAGLLGKYNMLTPAFTRHVPGLHNIAGNKNIFARPENLAIVTEATPLSFTATIRRVLFYGSFYEVEAEAAGNYNLTLRVTRCDAPVGTEVIVAPQIPGIRLI